MTLQQYSRIRYKSMHELVLEQLRRAILSGSLKPGERIDQNSLAREMGVSRMPVREALRRLEAEGLVSMRPHYGAVVTPISPEDANECYLIRTYLEGLAALLTTSSLSKERLEKMQSLFAEMGVTVERGDVDEFLRLDWAFHTTHYTAAPYPRIWAAIINVRERAERYVRAWVSFPGRLRLAQEGHADILDACLKRDDELAKRVTMETLERIRQDLVSSLKEALLAHAG